MGHARSAVRRTKKRSGGSGSTNNLPPIQFHQVHGDNIRISWGGTVARREKTFCKGVTFSNRPINVAENVFVKFQEVSNDLNCVICFGFTCNGPKNLRYHLPKYAHPNLINKPGYWIKALAKRFPERGAVIFCYVTQTGNMHFGFNGEDKGVFFRGVETKRPLCAIIDFYGESTAIKSLDPRQQLNNSRRNLVIGGDTSPGDPAATERLILPSLAALTIKQQNQQQP